MTANTASIVRDIKDFLSANTDPKFDFMKEFGREYPLAIDAIIAVTGGALHDPLTAILTERLTKAGSAEGKSRSYTRGGIAAEEESEKFYKRPNGEKYWTRDWGHLKDVQVVRMARDADKSILAYGPPGCGKTALFEAAFGEDLITVLGSGDTEVADLVGGYVMNLDGSYSWSDGPLLQAAERGVPLLIDEIGLIDTKVLSIVYGFMDGRKEYLVTQNPDRGMVKAAEGFLVVAATNPNAPGVLLSEALLSRFSIHVEMTTDWTLARTLSVPQDIIMAAQNLWQQQQTDTISWSPQFRELLAFRDLAKTFGMEWAVANLIASAPQQDRKAVAEALSTAVAKNIKSARI